MWQAILNALPASAPAEQAPPLARATKRASRHRAERILPDRLFFDEHQIALAAKQLGPPGPVPVLWARRMTKELLLRKWRHVAFRNSRNGEACDAYRLMRLNDFTGINILQAWANWRTIPRNLSGVAPARPLRAIDLCCGIGQSTAVLAHYLPAGSSILGLESSEEFVAIAERSTFLARTGHRADVSFRAQDVLKKFRDADGEAVPPASMELVNCIGAIGCHFTPADTEALVSEVGRVLVPGGVAMLDSGREGTSAKTLRAIAESAGFRLVRRAHSCVADPRWQLCFRKSEP